MIEEPETSGLNQNDIAQNRGEKENTHPANNANHNQLKINN